MKIENVDFMNREEVPTIIQDTAISPDHLRHDLDITKSVDCGTKTE